MKIKITIWRISWNFIPKFANLYYKRLMNSRACPKCGIVVETLCHTLRECPVTIEVEDFKFRIRSV